MIRLYSVNKEWATLEQSLGVFFAMTLDSLDKRTGRNARRGLGLLPSPAQTFTSAERS
jgi:hypothetical protein